MPGSCELFPRDNLNPQIGDKAEQILVEQGLALAISA
jgi:hypothetical protein